MDASSQRSETVDLILDEMRRSRLNDARGLERRTTDLETWVRGEVVRALERASRDDGHRVNRTAIDKDIKRAIRLAAKAIEMPLLSPLARRGFGTELGRLKAARWVPSSRQDGVAYKCADEAYYLVEAWTCKRPTGYESGPFRKITSLICQHTGHKCDEKRACANVLKNKRRYG